MDVIINIIIVFVIFASIMKRFQEVTQKGQEVRRPVTGQPRVPGPATETLDKQPSMPMESAPPATVPDTSTRTRTLEDLVEQLERGYREILDPKPQTRTGPDYTAAHPAGEDVFESTMEAEALAQPEHVRVPKAPGRTVIARSTARPSLAFSSSPLVNGLIMGEILGPPVALRTGMDSHRLI